VVEVPLEPTIAPVLVPFFRRFGVAEELDFHLLELPRTEREVPRRNLVAETLADLRDANRNANPRAIADVLEVDKDTLGGLGTEEGPPFLSGQRADGGGEHQVKIARLGQRARLAGIGTQG